MVCFEDVPKQHFAATEMTAVMEKSAMELVALTAGVMTQQEENEEQGVAHVKKLFGVLSKHAMHFRAKEEERL